MSTTTETAPQTLEEALATCPIFQSGTTSFEDVLRVMDYREYVELYFEQKRAFEEDGDDDFEDLGPLLTYRQMVARWAQEDEWDGEFAD